MDRPVVEYASSAWGPHTDRNINKLEAVQRRDVRFAYYRTTSSVSDMISNLGWETLQHRRIEGKQVMMYRITFGLIEITATTLLHPATPNTRGKSMRYVQPYCRTDPYRCSFLPIRDTSLEQATGASTNLEDLQRRTARSLLDTETCFWSVFKSILPVLTTPQMHLVNSSQCDNAAERALHLTREEEHIVILFKRTFKIDYEDQTTN